MYYRELTPIDHLVLECDFFFPFRDIFLSLLGFSPSGRFAKNVKGGKIPRIMEKRNYHTQELDLLDRLERFLEAELEKKAKQADEPARPEQLTLLAKLGIRPKWRASMAEADEMISHYRAVIGRNRMP